MKPPLSWMHGSSQFTQSEGVLAVLQNSIAQLFPSQSILNLVLFDENESNSSNTGKWWKVNFL
jgi:hypothetical protein